MITVIRCVISLHGDSLQLQEHLPRVPEPSSPSFSSSFLSFILTQEWQTYCHNMVSTRIIHVVVECV